LLTGVALRTTRQATAICLRSKAIAAAILTALTLCTVTSGLTLWFGSTAIGQRITDVIVVIEVSLDALARANIAVNSGVLTGIPVLLTGGATTICRGCTLSRDRAFAFGTIFFVADSIGRTTGFVTTVNRVSGVDTFAIGAGLTLRTIAIDFTLSRCVGDTFGLSIDTGTLGVAFDFGIGHTLAGRGIAGGQHKATIGSKLLTGRISTIGVTFAAGFGAESLSTIFLEAGLTIGTTGFGTTEGSFGVFVTLAIGAGLTLRTITGGLTLRRSGFTGACAGIAGSCDGVDLGPADAVGIAIGVSAGTLRSLLDTGGLATFAVSGTTGAGAGALRAVFLCTDRLGRTTGFFAAVDGCRTDDTFARATGLTLCTVTIDFAFYFVRTGLSLTGVGFADLAAGAFVFVITAIDRNRLSAALTVVTGLTGGAIAGGFTLRRDIATDVGCAFASLAGFAVGALSRCVTAVNQLVAFGTLTGITAQTGDTIAGGGTGGTSTTTGSAATFELTTGLTRGTSGFVTAVNRLVSGNTEAFNTVEALFAVTGVVALFEGFADAINVIAVLAGEARGAAFFVTAIHGNCGDDTFAFGAFLPLGTIASDLTGFGLVCGVCICGATVFENIGGTFFLSVLRGVDRCCGVAATSGKKEKKT
jgi:hypothetical protein